MEENRNENMEVAVENTNGTYIPENYQETDESGISATPIIIGGLLLTAAAAGVGLGWKKIKEKSEERQLKKFRKKGFTIIPPEDDEEDVVDGECVDVEESKEKEK